MQLLRDETMYRAQTAPPSEAAVNRGKMNAAPVAIATQHPLAAGLVAVARVTWKDLLNENEKGKLCSRKKRGTSNPLNR